MEEMKKHFAEMLPELGDYILDRLGALPNERKPAPKRRKTIRADVEPTSEDLDDFFRELQDESVIVRRAGGKVSLFKDLVPLWIRYLADKYDDPVDEKKKNRHNNTLRTLCQAASRRLPEDHPACALGKGKCFALLGWQIATDE